MSGFPAASSSCASSATTACSTVADRPQWRTISGGSRSYVEPLTPPLRRPASAPATRSQRIERGADGVRVAHAGGPARDFDQVVLACHSDQALALLADPPAEDARSWAPSVPATTTWCCTPTPALLPRRRRAWSSWNYRLRPGGDELPVYLRHEPPAAPGRRTPSA